MAMKIAQWYFTQLTVTLLNCRKVWSNLSHISSLLALFFSNEITVMVARVALATSTTITVVEFAKNSAKTTRKVT